MTSESVSKKKNLAAETQIDYKIEFKTRFQTRYDEWRQELEKKKDTPEQTDLPKEKDREVTDATPPDLEMIFGFKNEVKSMENFLLDKKVYKEFKSLVILGEYGVGKTTLCKMIFNQDNVKSTYAPRIWISMHSKEGEEDIKVPVLKMILKCLGVEESVFAMIQKDAQGEYDKKKDTGEIDDNIDPKKAEENEELAALLYALHLNLRWKKYLIVIDDVREKDRWDQKLEDDEEKLKEDKKWGKYLADGFPKGSGGRVIYTTRDETLAKKLVAKEHQIHHLWPMSDPLNVWRIYDAVIKKDKKEPPRNDKKCIDELMNKSRGLPLAATLLAKLEPVFLDDEKAADESNQEAGESDNQVNSTESGNQVSPAEAGKQASPANQTGA